MSGKNDGGSADYYQLPAGSAELQDLIEHKAMNFAVGNIFKAAYRLGAENSLSDRSRDLRKIMWFAERELQRLASQDAVAHKAPSLCDSEEKKQEVDYPFTFPPALRFMGVTSMEYVAKLREEVEEVATALTSDGVILELFDVIHAAETAVRSLGKKWNVDVGDIRDRCEAKNRARGYYER